MPAFLEEDDRRRICVCEHGGALKHAHEHFIEIQRFGEVDELARSPQLVPRPPQLVLDVVRDDVLPWPARLGRTPATIRRTITA